MDATGGFTFLSNEIGMPGGHLSLHSLVCGVGYWDTVADVGFYWTNDGDVCLK